MSRWLGIDFGKVRVGLAFADSTVGISFPLETRNRINEKADAAYFKRIVLDEKITGIVVGLPIHSDGREGDKAKEARAYGEWLHQTLNLPVYFFDERFSTFEANSYMREAGLNPRKRKEKRDQIAAQIILQGFIEAGYPENGGYLGPLQG
ncbi:MAG: Holliday junction resolvase RuvX [Planctomycetes bacterium]|nr:Holliday junction resolvase RuvX [Planctomycetota bacterium]